MKNKLPNKLPPFGSQVRDYTAAVSAVLYNLNIFGISAKNICSPGFNCHGCPWATFACPVGIIGYGFGVRSIPAFALGSVLAIGIIIGRLVCGYACPFGLLQEFLFRIKTRKFAFPKPMRYLKYLIMILSVFVLTFIFGFDVEEGYINVKKPVLAKVGVVFDTSIFADKNQGYFADTVNNEEVGIGGFGGGGGLFNAGSYDKSGVKSVGVAGSGGGFALDDILEDVEAVEEKVSSDSDESVYEFLKRSKEEEFEGAELFVEVTVENPSVHPVKSFDLVPVFYDLHTQEEIWRGDTITIAETLNSGESYTTNVFKVPYYIHRASFAVISTKTTVKQDYWPLFCTYCPVAALEADLPGELADSENISQLIYATTRMNPIRLGITIFILIGSVFISRFFCRGFCPLGAMYGVFSRFALVRIVVEKDGCVGCGKCDAVCPVGLDVRNEAGGSECIACGNCLRSCPKGTIKRKIGL